MHTYDSELDKRIIASDNFQRNLNQNTISLFENALCKMLAILSGPICNINSYGAPFFMRVWAFFHT